MQLPGRKSVTVGVLHTVNYRFADENKGKGLFVATTPPETIFVDAAVAVHPEDQRYARLIGAHVINPLTGHLLPVIADRELVQQDKGTGVVKVKDRKKKENNVA